MKDFLQLIQDLFEDVLFVPFHELRALELDSWFLANILNWLFMAVAFVAFIYWMKQLKKYNDNNEEDRNVKAHRFLGKNAEI